MKLSKRLINIKIQGASKYSLTFRLLICLFILQDSFDDLNPQLGSENDDSGIDSTRRQRFAQRLRQDSVNDFGESTETRESNLKTVCGHLIC